MTAVEAQCNVKKTKQILPSFAEKLKTKILISYVFSLRVVYVLHSWKQTDVEDTQLVHRSYPKHLVTFQKYQVLVLRRLGINDKKKSQERNSSREVKVRGYNSSSTHFRINKDKDLNTDARRIQKRS